ncbi:hypothetical protein [Paenibacillus sp. TH7-28]
MVQGEQPNNKSESTTAEGKQLVKEYETWRQQIKDLFGSNSYLFPPYDPTVGPLKMVYDLSDTKLSFDLYRSKQYSIHAELPGLQTARDHYYSFSKDKEGKSLDDSGMLAEYGILDNPVKKTINERAYTLNDNLFVYHEGDIVVYQSIDTQKENKGLPETIVSLLKEKGSGSAQINIANLEGRTRLEVYMMIDEYHVKIIFYIHNIEELDNYFND